MAKAAVLAVALLLAVCAALPASDMRRIKFSERSEALLMQEDVHMLAARGINFMDVTDHPRLGAALPQAPHVGPIPKEVRHKAEFDAAVKHFDLSVLLEDITTYSSFFTRFYTSKTGVEAAELAFFEYYHLNRDGANFTVEYFENSFPQPSVIARIPGHGNHSHERVILGGHIDSISGSDGLQRAPGADDDGSGFTTVMAVMRTILNSGLRFDRTLEFHGYAAEEVGLRGSQAIAEKYQHDGVPVYSMLQLDMTGYVDPSAGPVVGIVTDFVDNDLTAFVRKLVDAYVATAPKADGIHWVDTKCGYACSDHASWTKAGYRSAFPFETEFKDSNPNIHSDRDTIDRLDPVHLEMFHRLGLGYAIELAGVHHEK